MIVIDSKGRSNYPVFIGDEDVLSELNDWLEKQSYSNVFILCDEHTLEHCLPVIDWMNLKHLKEAEVLTVEPGEQSKHIEVYYQLQLALLEHKVDRKAVILNLGGGVVTDLGGFLASTFKRGIDFVNIPTSLLAMVDASIGGKTGINAGELKNQIGTFCEPKAIFINTDFLTTLNSEELVSGLAEHLKHLLIYKSDPSWMAQFNARLTINAIAESVRIKLHYTTSDLTESGIRKALNYGHTIGHAIESCLLSYGHPISHGKAVAMGMLVENSISNKMGMLSIVDQKQIEKLVLTVFDLKEHFERIKKDDVIQLLNFDKKNELGNINFTLLASIGNCLINQYPETVLIERSLEEFLS